MDDERGGRGRGRGRRRHGHAIDERGPRGRMRRGDIRTALLMVLAEQPGHGYEVMQTLEAKSGGAWRPSPGSVYPTLQLLEDEGLLRSTERDGKRVYEVTEAGRIEAEERGAGGSAAPWDRAGRGSRRYGELGSAMKAVHHAMRQVATAGDADQVERATEILRDARKQIYALLAED